MIELDRKVFGKITAKEIIGAEPPIHITKTMLEKEFRMLLTQLDSKSEDDLIYLLKQQQIAEKQINSRPGAMALAQNKIQMYTEFSQKYIQIIKSKLLS